MQWQQMDWSLMVDPFNLLDMRVVPCTLAIDEHGIIQAVQPRLDRADAFIELFVKETFAPPTEPTSPPTIITQADNPNDTQDATALADYAVSLALWSDTDDLNAAIAASQQALSLREDARTHFNLGVIYRMRYDSPLRQDDDFTQAVRHWSAALDHDPNNYIWRRRIQQYGPRLDKPYSFYDWVSQARADIRERGEKPLRLRVEPSGAEFAYPADDFTAAGTTDNPDPDDRIHHDTHGLVRADVVVVPPQIVAGESARVHITLRPTDDAHWNNEVDETLLWVDTDAGTHWTVDAPLQTVPLGEGATSHEARHFEFEVHSADDTPTGVQHIHTYSLYYICEEVNGICLYRRQDIDVPLEILPSDGRRLRDGG